MLRWKEMPVRICSMLSTHDDDVCPPLPMICLTHSCNALSLLSPYLYQIAVVGRPFPTGKAGNGKVFIYQATGGNWNTTPQIIEAPNTDKRYGK